MKKIILVFFVVTSSFAKVNDAKVDYLIDLLDLKKSLPALQEATYNLMVKKNPELEFVEKEFHAYMKKNTYWAVVRTLIKKRFKDGFTEEEINKLIAIHELPIMSKYKKQAQSIATTFAPQFINPINDGQRAALKNLMDEANKRKKKRDLLIQKIKNKMKK